MEGNKEREDRLTQKHRKNKQVTLELKRVVLISDDPVRLLLRVPD